MAIEEIRIKVTSDNKGADETIKKLVQIGEVDKKNADNFEKHNKKTQDAFKKTGDAAHGVAGRIEESFHDLGNRIMGYMALDKLIDFLGDAAHEFIEAEKNAKRLAFAIEVIGGNSSVATNKLLEQSKAIQEESIFSDDSVQQAQTALATYGLTAEQIEKLIPKIVDLASASGTDLATATDKVIMGINGQTRGLRDVGVAFKDTGDKTQNLSVLMDKLTKFQGASAAATETNAGKIEMMNNRLGEMKETIGEFLVNEANSFLSFFDLLTGKTDLATEQIKLLRNAMGFDKVTDDFLASISDKSKADQLRLITEAVKKYRDMIEATDEAYKRGDISFETAQAQTLELKENIIKLGQAYESILNPAVSQLGKDAEKTTQQLKDLSDQIRQINDAIYSQDLAMQKKALREKADADKEYAVNTISDSVELNERLLQIEEDYNQSILQMDKDAVNRKADEDIAKANKEVATQKQKDELVLAINNKRNQDLLALDQQYYIDDNKLRDAEFKKITDDFKALADEEKRLSDERFKETQELRLLDTKTGSEEERKVKIENIRETWAREKRELKDQHDQGLLIDEDYYRKREILNMKYQKQIDDLNEEALKKQEELAEARLNKILDIINSLGNIVFERIGQIIEQNIALIQRQQQELQTELEFQRQLAIAGEENDLAATERKAAELEKQRMIQEEKLRKAKELQTFLNLVMKFTEDDPNTALAKAIGQMALVKGAEALYMEQGGIIGQTSARSQVGSFGFSRLHPGGGDILVHAQKGEGMLSVNEMNNLGQAGFLALKNMLKSPMREIPIPQDAAAMQSGATASAINKLGDRLETAIKNKKEVSIDADKLGNLIVTSAENGIKETVTHVLRKPRGI